MYETFASNLEKANTEESGLQKAFEDLMAEKTAKNKLLRETATTKEGQKAAASQELADAEVKLEDTKAQLAEDEEFFETARQQCKDKSDSWDERKRLRTARLAATVRVATRGHFDEVIASIDTMLDTLK